MYERITRAKARTMHAEGEAVFCLPSNTNPEGIWVKPAEMPINREFDLFVQEYKFYNCNSVLGRNVSFYKEVK